MPPSKPKATPDSNTPALLQLTRNHGDYFAGQTVTPAQAKAADLPPEALRDLPRPRK